MLSKTASETAVEPTVRTRRASRFAKAARWGVRGLATLLVLALTGTALQAIGQARDAARYPAPGDLVDLPDGRRLHMAVEGRDHDGPVVVLETGLGGTSSAWGWIQPALAEHVTVVAYDRPGYGWSDRSPGAPHPRDVVADLRTGLDQLGLAGRGYVLVGHSLGAHYVRSFAQSHPGEVVATVLVDPWHERFTVEHPEIAYGTGQAALLRAAQLGARLGLLRIYHPFAWLAEDLPEPHRSHALAEQVTSRYYATYRAEAAAMAAMDREFAGSVTDLADLPLMVLMARRSQLASDQPLVDAMNELRHGLADLSSRGTGRVFADADHVSIVTHPDHAGDVVEAILDVVATAQATRN